MDVIWFWVWVFWGAKGGVYTKCIQKLVLVKTIRVPEIEFHHHMQDALFAVLSLQ